MKRKSVWILAAFALLVCVGATAQGQEPQKPVAVVVPFYSSVILQEEVEVLYQTFFFEFVRTEKCTVVDRGSFDKIKARQKFQLSDWSDKDKVAKLGKALNANVVVTGQIAKSGTDFVFITQILDVNSMAIISSSADTFFHEVRDLFGFFPEICQGLTNNLANPQNVEAGNYYIGDIGPGGGYVFYYSDEGFPVYESDDASPVICHYLECSPVVLGRGITWCSCGNKKWCDINTTYGGAGAGRLNTAHIVNYMHEKPLTSSNCAAKVCLEYSTGTTKAGEWYLPSRDELILIYENLCKSGKFVSSRWYLSSTQKDQYCPSAQLFSDYWRDFMPAAKDDKGLVVLAVRAF